MIYLFRVLLAAEDMYETTEEAKLNTSQLFKRQVYSHVHTVSQGTVDIIIMISKTNPSSRPAAFNDVPGIRPAALAAA